MIKLARYGPIELFPDAGHVGAAEGILWLLSTRGDNIPRNNYLNSFIHADWEPLRKFFAAALLPPACLPGKVFVNEAMVRR
jgi:hypothetical protein